MISVRVDGRVFFYLYYWRRILDFMKLVMFLPATYLGTEIGFSPAQPHDRVAICDLMLTNANLEIMGRTADCWVLRV